MKEQFRAIKFQKKNLILLEKIEQILKEYEQQGIKVTLRQLYYQLVARDIIQNKLTEYNKISRVVKLARYGGFIDWDAIEDRVRTPKIPNTFENIPHLLAIASKRYQLDRWKDQDYYIELWTEKDALSSVISPLTKKYQVTLSIVRGFNSTSDMYDASQRFLEQEGKTKILLYLGDHDPSGLNMDKDILERLNEFGVDAKVIRIGLTLEQVKKYSPPPNYAKEDDPRYKKYKEKFGEECWEVDALRPEVLQELIESFILKFLDLEEFNQVKKQEQEDINKLNGGEE